MTFFLIHTECLDQIPATLEILEADRDDRQSLARLLDASIPGSWPPPLLGETLEEFIQTVSEGDDPLFAAWYWVANDPEGGRVLIGAGGTATSPIAQDSVLIGYSVLDEFQGRGYATEAVRHLIPALFALLVSSRSRRRYTRISVQPSGCWRRMGSFGPVRDSRRERSGTC